MREEFADRLKKLVDGELQDIEMRGGLHADKRQAELEMVVALHEAANAINAGKTYRPTAS